MMRQLYQAGALLLKYTSADYSYESFAPDDEVFEEIDLVPSVTNTVVMEDI
jgi:hypothetical protein